MWHGSGCSIRCWLLLPLWGSVFVPCFDVHCYVCFLVLQSPWWGRESWLLYFVCLSGVLLLLLFYNSSSIFFIGFFCDFDWSVGKIKSLLHFYINPTGDLAFRTVKNLRYKYLYVVSGKISVLDHPLSRIVPVAPVDAPSKRPSTKCFPGKTNNGGTCWPIAFLAPIAVTVF